jgi:DNA polymerase III epsilon subunit-like protein
MFFTQIWRLKMGFRNLKHHLLTAIDIETTGLDSDTDEIVQFAAVPVDEHLEPVPNSFLHIYIRPEDPAALNKMSEKTREAVKFGMTLEDAVGVFITWFENLHLLEYRRLVPLGHNYIKFDERFIRNWLGTNTYDHYFDVVVRDTLTVAGFLNDLNDYQARPAPFPDGLKLSTLASRLEVEYDTKSLHDALYDAVLVSKVYKKMLQFGDRVL